MESVVVLSPWARNKTDRWAKRRSSHLAVNRTDVCLHGDAHRASTCSAEGESDISQILIGTGLGSSESSRVQDEVLRAQQPKWEKGRQEKRPDQTQGQLLLG